MLRKGGCNVKLVPCKLRKQVIKTVRIENLKEKKTSHR